MCVWVCVCVNGIKNMHKSSKAALTTNENMQKFIASEIGKKKKNYKKQIPYIFIHLQGIFANSFPQWDSHHNWTPYWTHSAHILNVSLSLSLPLTQLFPFLPLSCSLLQMVLYALYVHIHYGACNSGRSEGRRGVVAAWRHVLVSLCECAIKAAYNNDKKLHVFITNCNCKNFIHGRSHIAIVLLFVLPSLSHRVTFLQPAAPVKKWREWNIL